MLLKLKHLPRESCGLEMKGKKNKNNNKNNKRTKKEVKAGKIYQCISIFPMTMTAEKFTLVLPIPLRHFFSQGQKGTKCMSDA